MWAPGGVSSSCPLLYACFATFAAVYYQHSHTECFGSSFFSTELTRVGGGGCLQFLERGSGKRPAVLLLCM